MVNIMSKKKEKLTTFETFMQNESNARMYKEESEKLALSELLLELMETHKLSVRKLAKLSHLSPTIIQNIRNGSQVDVRLGNFKAITSAMGYSLILKKGRQKIEV